MAYLLISPLSVEPACDYVMAGLRLSEDLEIALGFKDEMYRFLPAEQIKMVEQDRLWMGIMQLLTDLNKQMIAFSFHV